MISADRLTRPAAPRVTLEQPIEHLLACHDRIEERLRVLERASAALAERPDEARAAIESVFRHFDTAGVLHTRDEEESVFPRLVPKMTAEERAYLESLEHQHREADEVYRKLRDVGAPDWRETIARFCALYRQHIASENEKLIGAARRLLGPEQIAEISQEMKGRRG
jgi:hemerythrin-like domain-containing protein